MLIDAIPYLVQLGVELRPLIGFKCCPTSTNRLMICLRFQTMLQREEFVCVFDSIRRSFIDSVRQAILSPLRRSHQNIYITLFRIFKTPLQRPNPSLPLPVR